MDEKGDHRPGPMETKASDTGHKLRGGPLCVAPGVNPGPEESSFLAAGCSRAVITETRRLLPVAHKQSWGVCGSHFTVGGEPQFKARPTDVLRILGDTPPQSEGHQWHYKGGRCGCGEKACV